MIKDNDKIYFLTAATYDRNKGQDVLIKSICLLPDEIKRKSVFTFIGCINDSRYYRQLSEAAKDDIKACIKLEKEISHDAMMEEIVNYDCIIVPSRFETLSLIAIEAMMMKKPIIVSDSTGISSMLNGYNEACIFRNEDTDDLRCKIEKMFFNNREEIGEYLFGLYKKVFSYKTFEDNVVKMVFK